MEEFLRAPNSKNLINAREENESIRDAKIIYDKALADPVQKEKMRLLEKTQMDNLSSMTKAHDEGLAEGLKKGKEEGLAEGLEKGEHNAKIETAKNMLQEGLSIDVVAKCTGLSVDEIKLL